MEWFEAYKQEMSARIVANPSRTAYCLTTEPTGHYLSSPTVSIPVTVGHNYPGFHTEHYALVIAHVKLTEGRRGFMPQEYSLLDGGRWHGNGSVYGDYNKALEAGKAMVLKTQKEGDEFFEKEMARQEAMKKGQ